MTYAAQLIDAVKEAKGLTTYRAVADALDVTEQALNAWRKGRGSPMPQERVLALCEMAHIADPGPWLVGIQADATRGEARRALDSVLDRVRPAVATVGTLAVALLVVSGLASNQHEHAGALAFLTATPEAGVLYIMRNWHCLGAGRAGLFDSCPRERPCSTARLAGLSLGRRPIHVPMHSTNDPSTVAKTFRVNGPVGGYGDDI